jgi:RNA polymerase sigma-70 factor (ECF subfamily)
MSQDEIIQKIKSGGRTELGLIYEEYREEFLRWVVKEFKCSLDDGKDFYQLTILIFHDNIKQGKLEHLVSSVKTYLFGIGKNIVKENFRKEKRFTPISKEKWLKDALIDEPSNTIEDAVFEKARNALGKLGQPCQRLIELFYYEKKSIPEITLEMNYKNPETAKNQKCKCMARLRKLFEQENEQNTFTLNHESL